VGAWGEKHKERNLEHLQHTCFAIDEDLESSCLTRSPIAMCGTCKSLESLLAYVPLLLQDIPKTPTALLLLLLLLLLLPFAALVAPPSSHHHHHLPFSFLFLLLLFHLHLQFHFLLHVPSMMMMMLPHPLLSLHVQHNPILYSPTATHYHKNAATTRAY
jgi:hypothetical protein